MKTIKNYLLENDPTLRKTTIIVASMYVITFGLIFASIKYHWINPHPLKLNPPGEKVYELNGYIPGTNQTWGMIQ